MPLPAAVLPLLQLGVQAGSTALSGGQSRQNRKAQIEINNRNIANEWKMYGQQRMDALFDWKLQNQYNHPRQQMQRLKEAGLNPNLIYGNGANAESANIRSSNANTPTLQAPQNTTDYSGLANALPSYMDAQVKQQTINNLQAQHDLILAQKSKVDVDVANGITEGETSKFQLEQAKALKDLTIEQAKLRNENIAETTRNIGKQQEFSQKRIEQKDIEIAINQQRLMLEKARTRAQIELAHENILRSIVERETNPVIREKMLQEIENAKKSGELMRIDLQLKQLGLQPGSPEYYKRWVSLVSESLGSIGSAIVSGLGVQKLLK